MPTPPLAANPWLALLLRGAARRASAEALPPALRTAAQLRLDHPELTLTELAALAGCARPTLAGRYRRLIELADADGEAAERRRPRP